MADNIVLISAVPFGKLPVLDIDGKILYQPLAIARYFGRKFNLMGSDDVINGQIDALAESIYYFWYSEYSLK